MPTSMPELSAILLPSASGFWEVFMKFLATLILAATLAVGIATILVSPPASANYYCGGSQCYGR